MPHKQDAPNRWLYNLNSVTYFRVRFRNITCGSLEICTVLYVKEEAREEGLLKSEGPRDDRRAPARREEGGPTILRRPDDQEPLPA
jgi:hypothetical protein